MAIDFESLGFAEVGNEAESLGFKPVENNRFFGGDKLTELGFSPIAESLTTGEKLQSAGASVLRGAGALLASIPKGVAVAKKTVDEFVPGSKYIPSLAMLIPPDTVIEKTKELEDWAGSLAPKEAEALKESWLWNKFPKGIGSAVGFLAGGAAGAAVKVPAWMGAASLGTMATYSETYEDAKRHGADEETALAAAFTSTPLGASEAVPMAKWINRLNRGTNGGFKRVLLNSAKETVEEALQEAFQASGGDLIAKGFYDPDRELFRDLREAAATGGAVGLFMSLLTQTVGNSLGKRRGRGESLRSRYEPRAIDEFKPIEIQPETPLERTTVPAPVTPAVQPVAVPVPTQPEVLPVVEAQPPKGGDSVAQERQKEVLKGGGETVAAPVRPAEDILAERKAEVQPEPASKTPKPDTSDVPDYDPEDIGGRERMRRKVASGKTIDEAAAESSAESKAVTDWVDNNTGKGDIVKKKDGKLFWKDSDGTWREVDGDGVSERSVTGSGALRGGKIIHRGMPWKDANRLGKSSNAPSPEAKPGEPAGGTAAVGGEPVPETGRPITAQVFRGESKGNHGKAVGSAHTFWSFDQADASTYGTVKSESVSLINPLVSDNWVAAKKQLGLKSNANMTEVLDAAAKAGHDGVLWTHNRQRELVKLAQPLREPAAAPVAEVPLGLNRPARIDTSLQSLSDEAFNVHYRKSKALVNEAEKRFDETPRELTPAERQALGEIQDSWTATSLERFRRNTRDTDTRDLMRDLLYEAEKAAKFGPDSEAFQRAGIIMVEMQRQGADLRKVIADIELRSPDAAEVFKGRMEDLRKVVEATPPTPIPESKQLAAPKVETPTANVESPKGGSGTQQIPQPDNYQRKLHATGNKRTRERLERVYPSLKESTAPPPTDVSAQKPAETPTQATAKMEDHVDAVLEEGRVRAANVVNNAKASRQAHVKAEREAKEIKSELVQRLEEALEKAKSEREMADLGHGKREPTEGEMRATRDTAGKITIAIPGDGVFTLWNTKEVITDVLSNARKLSVTQGVTKPGRKEFQKNNFKTLEFTDWTDPAVVPALEKAVKNNPALWGALEQAKKMAEQPGDSSIASGVEGGNVGASDESSTGQANGERASGLGEELPTQAQEVDPSIPQMRVEAMAEDLQRSGQILRAGQSEIFQVIAATRRQDARNRERLPRQARSLRSRFGEIHSAAKPDRAGLPEKTRVLIEGSPEGAIPVADSQVNILAHGILFGSDKKVGTQSVIDGFQFIHRLSNRLTGLKFAFLNQAGQGLPRARYVTTKDGTPDRIIIDTSQLAGSDLNDPAALQLWVSTLVEEALHALNARVSTRPEMAALWKELSIEEQDRTREIYGKDFDSDVHGAMEYARIVLQERLFGRPTELTKRGIKAVVMESWRKAVAILKSIFGDKPQNSIARQIVERMEAAIRGDAPIPEGIFNAPESFGASAERPLADILQRGDVDEAGDDYIPTEVFGVRDKVLNKTQYTEGQRQKARAIAQLAFDEAGLTTFDQGDDSHLQLVSTGEQENAAGQRLVAILRREIAKYGQGALELTELVQSIVLDFKDGRVDALFSQPIRNQLYSLAQGERSFRGVTLNALRGAGQDIRFIAQNIDVHLQRVWHEAFGGTEIDGVLSKIRDRFKAFFTPEVIAEIVRVNPEIAKVNGAEKIIADGLNTDFASLTMLRDTLADALQKTGLDKKSALAVARQMVEALKPRIRVAAGNAAKDIESALTPDEKIAVKGGRKPIWQKIVDMVTRGEFDNGPLLREKAKAHEWEPPSDEKIARIKRLAERERSLENLTQKEVDAAKGNPEKLAREKVVREQSTIPQRVPLMRQMEAEWASITRPVNLLPWRFFGNRRANNAAFLNELISANLLVRASFFPKQAISIFSQFMVHIPTRAIGQAIQLHAQSKTLDQSTALGKDVFNALAGGYKAALTGYKDGIAQFVAAFRGRGEVRNVDRLMSGISALERMDAQAQQMAERGDFGAAALQYLTSFMRLGYRIAQAFDNLHGVPSEYIEMRNRAVLELMKNGVERHAANEQADNIITSIKKDHIFALQEAKAFLEEQGEKPSANQLREISYRIARLWAYERMRAMGLPADDFMASARQLRETIGWNEREAGFNKGLGGLVGGAVAGLGKVGEKVGLPLAMGRFGNAIAININRGLHFTPLGFFPGAFGENNAWFKSESDRNQRKIEASIGTTVGSIAFMLAASGLITVYLKWPRDPEERDLFEADGHRPGTIEVGNVAISMNTGLAAFLAPYFAAGGALRDLLMDREKKQAKANDEAARKGLAPESIRPMSAGDMMGVAVAAGYHTILGGRTAAGSLASMSDYGIPNIKKLVASQTGPLIPGLPALQEVSRMSGVVLDSKLATFTDFLLPLPSSPARRVNFLGDPSGTPDDLQRIVQALTGGTYGPIDPNESKVRRAYEVLFTTGYRPPSVNPAKGFAIGNSFRPFTDAELEQYSAIRGEEFKNALGSLSADSDIKAVRAAYRSANQRALGRMGVRVTMPKASTARRSRSRLRSLRGRGFRTMRSRRRKGLRSRLNPYRLAA